MALPCAMFSIIGKTKQELSVKIKKYTYIQYKSLKELIVANLERDFLQSIVVTVSSFIIKF
jgi:hypothetical protein